jgi:hypothetical protein
MATRARCLMVRGTGTGPACCGGRAARDWAKVMLTLNLIDFIELEHAGERLLDALWSASADAPIAMIVP